MADYVTASDGTQLDLDSLEHTYGYSGSVLTSDTVTYLGNTYVKTYVFTGSNLTFESRYVKQ